VSSSRRSDGVLAAATVHFPYITAWPERAPAEEREATMSGFARLGRAFVDEGIDTVVAFTSEHIVNLQPRLAAPFLIGLGQSHGAFPEPHFNLKPFTRRGDPELASYLTSELYDCGFDVAHSSELLFDHGTVVPLALMNLPPSVAIVPVIINSIFKPLPSLDRCRAFGLAVKEALARSNLGRRVGLLATGGISHTVGAPGPEQNDPSFDERFVGALARCDLDTISCISDKEIDAAGNGTHEIRNWVAVAGAMHPRRPKIVTAIPYVTGWSSGVHQLLWEVA
jgi:aromatic ring-opening dioxygenase catalytic subunit (LigB family)